MKRAEGYIHPRRQANIDAVLGALPATRDQLAQRTGLHKATIVKLVKALHGTQMRVGRWLPHPVHGPSIAVFVAGAGPDAEDKLPRLTSKQRSARYEARIKGSEKHDRRKAKQMSYYFAKRAVAKPQHWASTLFDAGRRASAQPAARCC
jgi:hypothetical protein